MISYHIAVISFALPFLTLLTAQQCYWPSGSIADSSYYKPCGNGRGSCCYYVDNEHHDPCYDNGLCYSWFFANVYRGACTDQSWNSKSGCATQCLDCKCADQSLCCGAAENATTCCSQGGGFIFSNATFMGLEQQTSSTTAVTTDTATGLATGPVAVTETTTTTTTVAGISSTGSVNGKNCSQKEAAVGAGLGVPLGLALLTVVGYIIYSLSVRKRAAENTNPGGNQQTNTTAPFRRTRTL
ncbi:hypothetical protein AOQ84DRAFT_390636 [Glonium stellatum]|uniref:Mid2 domain-containing protein n=1 Tax=Glonium stellatum TaxID=574774 RepID=A0A8E2EW11_9PEZI|nr:hypothetical protein AOQ84DRAFT_390636 [Glonium stellatum]